MRYPIRPMKSTRDRPGDTALSRLCDDVLKRLRSFHLRDHYSDEQRDLQTHIMEELQGALPKTFTLCASTGGSGPKPSVRLHGTSFWPDIEVCYDRPLVGIEVKLVRVTAPKKSYAKPLAETIGQCLIYTVRYPCVIGFVLNDGIYDCKGGRFGFWP